jgi:hypothetical protein
MVKNQVSDRRSLSNLSLRDFSIIAGCKPDLMICVVVLSISLLTEFVRVECLLLSELSFFGLIFAFYIGTDGLRCSCDGKCCV